MSIGLEVILILSPGLSVWCRRDVHEGPPSFPYQEKSKERTAELPRRKRGGLSTLELMAVAGQFSDYVPGDGILSNWRGCCVRSPFAD